MTEAPVSRARAAELFAVVIDEHAVLGPLDRADLESLLAELLEWRTEERVFSAEACIRGQEGVARITRAVA